MATARDLMTSPAEFLQESDSLTVAAQALKTSNVGSMPVKDDNGKVVGVVTDRDIVVKSVAEGANPDDARVADVASSTVVSVSADDDAQAVMQALSDNQVRRLPVLDGEELVGVISQADVARELSAEQTGDVVRAISQR